MTPSPPATPSPDAPKENTGAAAKSEHGPALQRERQRVADVLHDTVCQELTGIALMASAAAREYRAVCPEAEQKLKEIARLIQDAGIGLQGLMRDLRAGR